MLFATASQRRKRKNVPLVIWREACLGISAPVKHTYYFRNWFAVVLAIVVHSSTSCPGGIDID